MYGTLKTGELMVITQMIEAIKLQLHIGSDSKVD